MAYVETGEFDVPIVRVIRLVTVDIPGESDGTWGRLRSAPGTG